MPRPAELVDAADLQLDPLPVSEPADLQTALAALVHWFDSRHVRDDVRAAVEFPSTELLDFLAVNQLTLRGALRATDLAEALQTSRPNLSKVARRLEAMGLAARTADPADDRGVLLALTPQGRRIGQRILDHNRAALGRALAGWDSADVEALSRLVARFTECTTPDADDPVRGGFAYPRNHPVKGSDDDVFSHEHLDHRLEG